MPSEAELFFQTDTSIAAQHLRHAKSKNENGRPIRPSPAGTKILHVLPAVRVRAEAPGWGIGGIGGIGGTGEIGGSGRNGSGEVGDEGLSRVYVAESGGWVREVCLETSETKAIYVGPTAPLTSLAYSAATATLYAGCWDTCIWAWDVRLGREDGDREESKSIRDVNRSSNSGAGNKSKPARRVTGHRFTPVSSGHTGFVKTLRLARLDGAGAGKELLFSGGADGAIYIWNTENGKRTTPDDVRGNSLKGLDRSVAALAVDPFPSSCEKGSDDNVEKGPYRTSQEQNRKKTSPSPSPLSSASTPPSVTLLSAGSGISIRQWAISEQPAGLQTHPLPPLPPHTHHASSISALTFDKHGDLWSASADRTVRHLVRDRNWAPDTHLDHPDVVLDILVLDVDHPELRREFDGGENEGWVATACMDEHVRIWDGTSGTLLHTFTGHFAPVSALCLAPDGTRNTLVSVSLDGTIRRWRLDRLRQAVMLAERMGKRRIEKGRETEEEKAGGNIMKKRSLKPGTDEWEGESEDESEGKGQGKGESEAKRGIKKTSLMTEEEERELEDLMGDDDDDGI